MLEQITTLAFVFLGLAFLSDMFCFFSVALRDSRPLCLEVSILSLLSHTTMLSCALIHIFRSLLVSCLNLDRLCLVIVLHALWTRLARFLCGSMQNLNQESFVVDEFNYFDGVSQWIFVHLHVAAVGGCRQCCSCCCSREFSWREEHHSRFWQLVREGCAHEKRERERKGIWFYHQPLSDIPWTAHRAPCNSKGVGTFAPLYPITQKGRPLMSMSELVDRNQSVGFCATDSPIKCHRSNNTYALRRERGVFLLLAKPDKLSSVATLPPLLS